MQGLFEMSPEEMESAINGLLRRVYALEQSGNKSKLVTNSGDVWEVRRLPSPPESYGVFHRATPNSYVAVVHVEELAHFICRSMNRHKACEDLLKQILADVTASLDFATTGTVFNKPIGLDYRSLQHMIRELIR